MTKRIIALVLVAIMAAVALVACAEDPATTSTPTASTNATTAAPTTSGSESTPTTGKDTVATPTPTPTETATPDVTDPIIEDPFTFVGGLDAQWGTGSSYGEGWETWPFAGNNEWCARAFWQLCVQLSTQEADFTENMNNPADYKYTWKLWYKDSEADPYVQDNWKGPYTLYAETCYVWGGDNPNVIYRLQTDGTAEGDPCKKFELGKSYDYIIQVTEGEDIKGFMMVSYSWTAKVDAQYKVYTNFWSSRNREDGYTAADQTITDADIAYAKGLGFDEAGVFTDPNAPTE